MEVNKLYNMDCIAGMGQLQEASVDLAFADPPFNIGYDYDVYEDQRAAEEYLDWTRQWGRALVRTLKPSGTFWLAIGDDFAAELKLIFQKDLGLHCRSWVIWYYTFGVNCSKKFSRSHTHLFHFVRDPKEFKFNADAIRVPSARQLVYADSRADSRGRLPDDTWILRPQDAPEAFQFNEDTWYFPRVCGTFKERAGWHGCQMPEQLLGRIVKCCSDPDDLVLDPFAGSGTTLVAAKKLGRRFVGFELSTNYAKQTQARIDAAAVGEGLAGPANPLASAPPTAKPVRRVEKAIEPMSPQPKGSAPSRESLAAVYGVVEAFHAVRHDFPVDRVIADPDMNSEFAEKCKQLGLPGCVREWNERLMNLRKAGFFKGLPRARRTSFPQEEEEYERYKFAFEIGLEHCRLEQTTLDAVLCDPAEAAKFDRLINTMLPYDLDSLRIRWYSLRLRKQENMWRKKAKGIRRAVAIPSEFVPVGSLDPKDVPAEMALYWLRADNRNLYVGQAANLRHRFETQFAKNVRFAFWNSDRANLEVAVKTVDTRGAAALRVAIGNQSLWIARWNPVGNYQRFAAKR